MYELSWSYQFHIEVLHFGKNRALLSDQHSVTANTLSLGISVPVSLAINWRFWIVLHNIHITLCQIFLFVSCNELTNHVLCIVLFSLTLPCLQIAQSS